MSEVGEPRKFKLRRIKPVEEIIQKNLEPLKENIRKKKRAQEAYYEKHNESGTSPLRRDFNKRPVHQRLGRKLPYTLGTNTSAILPKRRLKLPGSNQLNRRTRLFSAQQRLNIIRAKQREVLSTHNGNISKRIKLRRSLPLQMNGPTNLQVQVQNHSFLHKPQIAQSRRFKQMLNGQLQLEIKKIQMDFQGGQIIAPQRITPSATEIPLHKRFAELS